MGKNDHARLPSVNKTMFDKGNWQAFTAVVKYFEDLTVWAATTKEKGEDGKKYNLLWLLPRNCEGEGGRVEMDMSCAPTRARQISSRASCTSPVCSCPQWPFAGRCALR